MSKVVVKGGAPGFIRIEVEGTDTSIDISNALPAYTAVQECCSFMQALLDAVPPPVAKPSKAPPAGP